MSFRTSYVYADTFMFISFLLYICYDLFHYLFTLLYLFLLTIYHTRRTGQSLQAEAHSLLVPQLKRLASSTKQNPDTRRDGYTTGDDPRRNPPEPLGSTSTRGCRPPPPTAPTSPVSATLRLHDPPFGLGPWDRRTPALELWEVVLDSSPLASSLPTPRRDRQPTRRRRS